MARNPNRRQFLAKAGSTVGTVTLGRNAIGLAAFRGETSTISPRSRAEVKSKGTPTSTREFLREMTHLRKEVDTFLDPQQPNWARFDPELGYTLRDNILKDGVDGSRTLTSYEEAGQRRVINYADCPSRISSFGDSFTQCHQASDGETWQEYLAAHLGEPILNFGIGGYGTYQAYRRMLGIEGTGCGADYLILNIWDIDDYFRTIDAWRWLRVAPWWRQSPGHLYMFHCNPWVHVRLDLATGKLIEKENAFATPESLYKLCDPEFVFEHFKDDLIVKLLVAQHGGIDVDRKALTETAEALSLEADFGSLGSTIETAHAIHIEYALRTGMRVIERATEYARTLKKKLMVLLSCSAQSVVAACEGRRRLDQPVVDFLRERNILFVDGLTKHLEDFKNFNLSPQDYAKRYYIGHYNPRGNHFFAFAIKDPIVSWLDPKPRAYREGAETIPAVV